MDYAALDDVRNEIDKDIERDLNSMYELRRSESASQIIKEEKDSLVFLSQNRYEFFEKLKKNWHVSHSRIKDFNQKKLQQYQQIYRLKYMYMYDISDHTYHNRINALSKYTFTLSDDVEFDIGGHVFSKEPIGLGSFFTGLRFYAFQKKLFINTHGSFGDNRDILLETNYLFKHNLLLDYVFRRNQILKETQHHIFLNKIFSKELQGSFGFKYKEKTENTYLSLNCKKYFGRNVCLNAKADLGLDQLNINTKSKHRITDNFFTLTKFKFELNYIYPTFHLKNSILYSRHNKSLRLGYFFTVDGVGFEIGYNNGGTDIRLPFLVTNGLDFSEKHFTDGLIDALKGIILFYGLNMLTSILLKGISYLFAGRNLSKEELMKRRSKVEESRNYATRIIQNIYTQADANHSAELCKLNKGLIVHMVLYGNKKQLKYIMNNFLYMKTEELANYLNDIDNEVFDVTVPVRYMIKKDTKLNFSSILFYQIPKTKIIGFVNPIYSKVKMPYLLISYEVNGISNTILKKDSDIFQIPEVI